MPQLGLPELVMIAAIALIVFGPQKLPEIARTVGRFMTQMRRMASEVRDEFAAGLDDPGAEEGRKDDDVADEKSDAIEDAARPGEESGEPA